MSAVLRRVVRAALVAGTLCLLTGCSAVSGSVPPGSGTGGIGGAGTAAAGPGAVSVSAAASAATAPGAADTPSTATGTAVALLATLPVKGRAAATGYDRVGDFGTAWLDRDHDGCDTRDDVLARDLTDVERPGGCRVLSGTLVSPYTGAAIRFTRGATTSAAVQIDHVVALEDAWQTGRSSSTRRLGRTWRTTRATSWRSTGRRTSRRGPVMPPHGCRTSSRSGAPTWPGRSR